MILFWQQWRAQLPGLIIWTAAGALVTLSATVSAPAAVAGGSFQNLLASLPPKLQAMMGVYPGLSPLDYYLAIKLAPAALILLVLYGVMLALSVVTREVDRRTIEFLLSLPVRRSEVLRARMAVMVANTALLACVLWLVAQADVAARGLAANWGGYGLVVTGAWLLAVAMAALTLLASLWVDDYSLAVKLFLGAVAAAFFAEMFLRSMGLERWQRALSPFSYVDAGRILETGALPLADTALLAGVAVLALALSFPVFARKQISA